MFDALSRLGLPVAATLVLAAGFLILYEYYKHRLEREREWFMQQLTLIEDAQARRFTALMEARHLFADLLHSTGHVARGDLDHVDRLHSYYIGLREHVREHSLLLGDAYLNAIYTASEHALGVLAARAKITGHNISRMQMAELPSEVVKTLESRIGQELSVSDVAQLFGDWSGRVLFMSIDFDDAALRRARDEVDRAESALLSSIPLLGEIFPSRASAGRPTPQWSGRIPHFVRSRRSP